MLLLQGGAMDEKIKIILITSSNASIGNRHHMKILDL